MASKTMKNVWYCPCNCTTPKGMKKKFYKINTLYDHIISEHSDTIETKFMYRLSTDKNPSTKKRTYDECEEDGFKELLSVEEEEEEEKVNELSNNTAMLSLK